MKVKERIVIVTSARSRPRRTSSPLFTYTPRLHVSVATITLSLLRLHSPFVFVAPYPRIAVACSYRLWNLLCRSSSSSDLFVCIAFAYVLSIRMKGFTGQKSAYHEHQIVNEK